MKRNEKLFTWKSWGEGLLPELEPHSEAKLKVLQDYVIDYIKILCSQSFGQDRFRITLVDGFSGGGIYKDGKLGSPFVLIKGVEIAEASLNSDGRNKLISIDCDYHFIDDNKKAIECLRYQFETSGYKDRLNKTVFIHHGSFEQKYHAVVERLKKRHPRGGARVIFFLDQCGYTKVDPQLVRSISNKLDHKAEFIINYAIEWLTDFSGNNDLFRKRFTTMNLGSELSVEELIKIKETEAFHWKYLVEAKIGPAFRKISGSPFFSPFYIEPVDGHRGYWLLHLAPHERARSAMMDVHWKHANSHRHFGHSGFNMLAFKADADPTGYMQGMNFNELTLADMKNRLAEDFAREIRDSHAKGVTFERFSKLVSNSTMATHKMKGEVIQHLVSQGDLIVTGPKGSQKRGEKINSGDIILPCYEKQLVFPVCQIPAKK
jgi:three-Cys-motif partner protein